MNEDCKKCKKEYQCKSEYIIYGVIVGLLCAVATIFIFHFLGADII